MSDAVYEALRAIQSDLSQVEVLAQGIANANTAGFRSAEVSSRPFDVGVAERTSADPVIRVNQRSGSLTATGQALDIAVTGNGYLQVETESSNSAALVRGGALRISSEGVLTTATGHAVLVDGGRLQVDAGQMAVTTSGDVLLDGQPVGRLSLVELLEPEALTVAGEGVYEIPVELIDTAPTNVSVLQGYLEQSNVNSSESIIRMMELSKHVESVQRSLVALDELMDSSINDLGRR
jgi:flagellar basal body rod protein FlgG